MNTPIPLWTILAIIIVVLAVNIIADWFGDQYEVTWHGLFPARFTRRWYGNHAHVVLRGDADDEDAARYVVLSRVEDDLPVPWLLVHKLDPEFLTYWDEDAESFLAPVTEFAPYAVRRLRPHIWHLRRLPLPWFTSYRPLRRPAGYLEVDA